MDELTLEHPDEVRARIAGDWLRAESVDPILGAVRLRAHQVDAVRRIRALLDDGGGALLCDDVGLGKTYVALAIARSYSTPLVIAPASLRDMWRDAAHKADLSIRFITTESLSRRVPAPAHDLIVVDEAHHFRTRSTRRYKSLATLCARSRLLLLSATPLHNARADLLALLALFLGSASATLDASEVTRHIVRRDGRDLQSGIPPVRAPVRLSVSDNAPILTKLMALPAPTPTHDGQAAAAMVLYTLVRLWASSDAALREGLRRRLGRAFAIRHALEAGRHPTRRELESWAYGEGSVQLGFAGLLAAAPVPTPQSILQGTRAHEEAIAELLAAIPAGSAVDVERAARLRSIRQQHQGQKIIAFSRFAETVRMYFRQLRGDAGVAMLTSRNARIASGVITRAEALARFAPVASGTRAPARSQNISLLLATDLLSEGVNLQDASIVVHLDLPWTAATIEQRVGRVARSGSTHAQVAVYTFDPPAASEQLLHAEATICRKLALTESNIGASRIPPLFPRPERSTPSAVEDAEAVRRVMIEWSQRAVPTGAHPACGFVTGGKDGLVILATVRGTPRLLVACGSQLTDDVSCVRAMLEAVIGAQGELRQQQAASALAVFHKWADQELTSHEAGTAEPASSALARRLILRLATELSRASLRDRNAFAKRIANVQQRLCTRLTLGVERELEEISHHKSGAAFLDDLERALDIEADQPMIASATLRAILVVQCESAPHAALTL